MILPGGAERILVLNERGWVHEDAVYEPGDAVDQGPRDPQLRGPNVRHDHAVRRLAVPGR